LQKSKLKDQAAPASRKKSFITLPKYTGGKKAFMEFVSLNLTYPEEALKNKIEGLIHAEYEVDNLGKISDIRIKKGIGYGCDEEAIRILSLMFYEPVHNRGLRIKSKMKARILFKLPIPSAENSDNSININYTISKKKLQQKEDNQSYSYTINLG
jgi:TonB family protein